jgi:hypothetical protein
MKLKLKIEQKIGDFFSRVFGRINQVEFFVEFSEKSRHTNESPRNPFPFFPAMLLKDTQQPLNKTNINKKMESI